jgi:hypothetical protein
VGGWREWGFTTAVTCQQLKYSECSDVKAACNSLHQRMHDSEGCDKRLRRQVSMPAHLCEGQPAFCTNSQPQHRELKSGTHINPAMHTCAASFAPFGLA